MLIAVSIILTILVLLLLHTFILTPLRVWLTFYLQSIPCSPYVPGFGQALQFAYAIFSGHYQAFSINSHRRHHYAPMYVWQLGPLTVLNIASPAVANTVLRQFDYRSAMTEATMLPLTGPQSLFMVDRSTHAAHRRAISKAFQYTSIQGLTQTMAHQVHSVIDSIKQRIELSDNNSQSISIDVRHMFTDLTLCVIAACAFGQSYINNPKLKLRINSAFATALDAMFIRNMTLINYIPIIKSLPIMYKPELDSSIAYIQSVICDTIAERRLQRSQHDDKQNGNNVMKQTDGGGDLLDILLDCVDENSGESMNNGWVMDQCLTFFLAGHETSASLMSWCFYQLTQQPQSVIEQLRAEVDKVFTSNHDGHNIQEDAMTASRGSTTNVSTNDLIIVEAFLTETLRLYPSAPIIFRQAEIDSTLIVSDGKTVNVPAGTMLSIDVTAIHRSITEWGGASDAHRFDHTRHIVGHVNYCPPSHPYRMISFGSGHHACIGATFAMTEAKLILAMMLHQLDWSYDASQSPVRDQIKITLNVKDPLIMQVSKRK